MPLTADHIADVAIHTTIAVVAVWQVLALLMMKPPALLRDGFGDVPAYGRSG